MNEPIRWTELAEIAKLQVSGMSKKEIAERLGISVRQVKRRLHYYHSTRKKGSSQDSPHGRRVTPNEIVRADGCLASETESETFQDPELFANLEAKARRREIHERYAAIISSGEPVKFLHLCDLHIPFHNMAVVQQGIDYAVEHGIHRCVVNGDFLDLYGVSKFAKDKHVEIRREITIAEETLDLLCRAFDEVILIEGNHCRRIKKYVAERIDTSLQFLFSVDVLELLASNRRKVTYAKGWWVKIGSVIFAHPDNFSSVPAKTAINTSQYFKARNEFHTAVVIGHTHKLVSGLVANGVAHYEGACLAHDMDYLDSGKMTYNSWVRGFGDIRLTSRGDIDFNNSRIVLSSVSG